MEENGWLLLNEGSNIYYQADAKEAGETAVVFNNFTVSSDVIDLSTYDGKTIIVTAYAVQADGFNSATEAWEAANLVS